MKQETITNAVEVINRNITKYEIELYHLPETKENDNDSQIKRTKDIIYDLKKIMKEIQNGQQEVKLEYCCVLSRGMYWIHSKICDVLKDAGFDFDEGSTPGSIFLIPINDDELDEEYLEFIAWLKSIGLSKS